MKRKKQHRFVVVVKTSSNRASAERSLLLAFGVRQPDGHEFHLLRKKPSETGNPKRKDWPKYFQCVGWNRLYIITEENHGYSLSLEDGISMGGCNWSLEEMTSDKSYRKIPTRTALRLIAAAKKASKS